MPCHCSPPEGSIITKEGMLHYKAGTSYLGKEHWKTCFVVLSNGILYQYPDRTDVTPLLSVNMGSSAVAVGDPTPRTGPTPSRSSLPTGPAWS